MTNEEGKKAKRELPERWSAQQKAEVVLGLLRGEDLGEVSREIQVPAHETWEWPHPKIGKSTVAESILHDALMRPFVLAAQRPGDLPLQADVGLILRVKSYRLTITGLGLNRVSFAPHTPAWSELIGLNHHTLKAEGVSLRSFVSLGDLNGRSDPASRVQHLGSSQSPWARDTDPVVVPASTGRVVVGPPRLRHTIPQSIVMIGVGAFRQVVMNGRLGSIAPPYSPQRLWESHYRASMCVDGGCAGNEPAQYCTW